MPDTFVLRYPAPGADGAIAEWLVTDAAGARSGPTGRGTLELAAAAAGGRRLVLLVPGTDVTLAAPALPAKGAAKLLRLAPYALEEQLATEVDSLHFAIGRQGADQRVPVAAIERERLARWLAELGAAGLTPAAVHPDSLALPENPTQVVVLIEADRVWIRKPGALPLVLDSDPLEVALALAGLPPAAGEVAAAPHVLLYVSAAEWERQRASLEALRDQVASLKVQRLNDGALPLFAASVVAAPPLSLLQGEFQPRHGFASEWPRWRLAASLFAGLLALHLATLGVDGWRLHRDEAGVDQRLRAAAAEALPNIAHPERLPSVRAAVEARLRAARAAVSAGLLGTLGVVGHALAAAPGTRVEALSYHDGVTDLTVNAPDVGTVDRMQQDIRSRGYGAELQGAAQHEQRTQGRLQLREPGR